MSEELGLVREYAPGIGQAVSDRTINRDVFEVINSRGEHRIVDNSGSVYSADQVEAQLRETCPDFVAEGPLTLWARKENWGDVCERVSLGNSLLDPRGGKSQERERKRMLHHMQSGTILMSGRHLQHGDAYQAERPMEVFTNCATAATSFMSFYLLLNGSGVGRSFDDELMIVDWRKMPIVCPTISADHPDVLSGDISNAVTKEQAIEFYSKHEKIFFDVADSREGWAKALELVEILTHRGDRRDYVLVLDFSNVRGKNSAIGGMQNRPASGPGPLITAFVNMSHLRNTDMPPWESTMWVDHYFAECVLVGGARRAARLTKKSCDDPSIFDFIAIKKNGDLWTANNSIGIHEEFRRDALVEGTRAHEVFEHACFAAYDHGTGEPGFVNVDKLAYNEKGMDVYSSGDVVSDGRYVTSKEAKELYKRLNNIVKRQKYPMIVNPCGEIALMPLCGLCVIGDVAPYHAEPYDTDRNNPPAHYDEWDDNVEDAMRTTARALIRTNQMQSVYNAEVARTNRIGVGMTGIHEYAWSRFGYGWDDLINEEESLDFWLTLSRFKRGIVDECKRYSKALGVNTPHTNTTIKPAGTTSKIFNLTEGAHPPARREYLRWVQYRSDDPLIEGLREKGYPIKELEVYSGTTIVGFPTQPEICKMNMGDKLKIAGEIPPEEQFQWLKLLEKYWIVGVKEDGVTPLKETGNQISYTLKYDTAKVSFDEMKSYMLEVFNVRCCSVLPFSEDASPYEYLPEESVTKHEYDTIMAAIKKDEGKTEEDVDFEHIDCDSGACPIDFNK